MAIARVFVRRSDYFRRKLVFILERGARPEDARPHLRRVLASERVTCFIILLSKLGLPLRLERVISSRAVTGTKLHRVHRDKSLLSSSRWWWIEIEVENEYIVSRYLQVYFSPRPVFGEMEISSRINRSVYAQTLYKFKTT